MGKLTAKQVDAELKKPRTKKRKIADGEGLFLEIPISGKGRWRFKYRFQRKEKLLSLGGYPDVTLKQAREKHREMRKLHSDGIDPSVARKTEQALSENTFEKVAREWHAQKSIEWGAARTKW